MTPSYSRLRRRAVLWMCCSGVLLVLLAVLLVSGFGDGSSATSGQAMEQPIATVNGEPIPQSRLYEALMDATGQEALEQLIVGELIDQEADKKEIAVTEAAVDEQLDLIKREYESPEEYRSQLKKDGYTDRSMRMQVRRQLQLRGLLADRIVVSEEEKRSYYEQNKALWGQPEAVHAAHILLKSREQAEQVVSLLAEGQPFAELVAPFSSDPGAAGTKGELGFVERGYLESGLEDVLFSMQAGDKARIAESSQGFHVVIVTERREAVQPSYEDRKEQLRNELVDARIYELLGPWIEQLRMEAKIELLQGAGIG